MRWLGRPDVVAVYIGHVSDGGNRRISIMGTRERIRMTGTAREENECGIMMEQINWKKVEMGRRGTLKWP